MNPRRPTPSGPQPTHPLPSISSEDNRFHSNVSSNMSLISGKLSETVLRKFLQWCVSKGTSRRTCEQYVKYLRKPLDPGNKWSVLAWKAYFKYSGNEELWKKIKTKQSRPDLNVPTFDEVAATLEAACNTSRELCIIYRLLVESGARLTEIVKMLKEFDPSKLKEHKGFFTYTLGFYRGSKRAYYVFTVTKPEKLVISGNWVSNWASKNKLVCPKYIRKFVATMMASLEIPTEVINFIQGRAPRTVLERNYLSLYALALKYYPKYASWLRKSLTKVTSHD